MNVNNNERLDLDFLPFVRRRLGLDLARVFTRVLFPEADRARERTDVSLLAFFADLVLIFFAGIKLETTHNSGC